MKIKVNKVLLIALAITYPLLGKTQGKWKIQQVAILSRWAKEVSPSNALKEYPRPQLVRTNWTNLNGLWDYTITSKDAAQPSKADGRILVPYPLESALSGVKKVLLPNQNLWYKRTFNKPAVKNGDKVKLNFGAVDYQATVFVNGIQVGQHEGGYTAFDLDITQNLKDRDNEIVVKVYDPTGEGIGPHGKQVLNPASIYYTPTSGIWQTVWMEVVPAASIASLTVTPDIDQSLVNITVNSAAKSDVQLILEGQTVKGLSNVVIQVPVKKMKLWTPDNPYLYDFTAKLGNDVVKSYFGMRKISIAKDAKGVDRIFLNNKPYYNVGTLDQGFWPEGLYTAPTDEALAFDIKAIKAMGFNTIRKHIKVEPARWYYHADKLGMLVWQDMVNPNQSLPEGSKAAFEKGSAEIMKQLHNYPSITTWVLFNEKWGQYDQERLTKWIKTTDPSRIVNGHSGELLYVNEVLRSPSPNAYMGADMTDVHSYPDPMNALAMSGKARVLGEFGGIGVFIPDHQWNTSSAWGYINEKPADFAAKYKAMNEKLKELEEEGLSASIYTQPFDVEGEQNGLMTYDREVIKIPFAQLREIHKSLNPDMGQIPNVVAEEADLTDPAILYERAKADYLLGNSSAVSIKRLLMMAVQNADEDGKLKFGKLYVKSLASMVGEDEAKLIIQLTKSTSDPGFAFMQQHADEFSRAAGKRNVELTMMNAIYRDFIGTHVSGGAAPDWESVALKIAPYGAIGEEILLRSKTFYYLNAKDWKSFGPVAKVYLEKYGTSLSDSEYSRLKTAIDWNQ